MQILTTERLSLEPLREEDAGFNLTLLNDPDFIANVADRGVRSLEDSRRYLRDGPIASYREHGFGMLAVRLRTTGEAVGMCGLVRREALDDVDIGFAFLPAARGRGYALEAARRVREYALNELGLERLVAIVAQHNRPSRALLEKLGLGLERMIVLPGEQEEICLYAWPAPAA